MAANSISRKAQPCGSSRKSRLMYVVEICGRGFDVVSLRFTLVGAAVNPSDVFCRARDLKM